MTQPNNREHLMPVSNKRNGLICLLIAALLMGSWFIPITNEWWDALDDAVYFAMNGTVQWGSPWPEIWAATGDRRFDLFCGVLILSIFYARWLNGTETQWRQGVALGFYMLIVIFLVVTYQREILVVASPSPSLYLEPFYSIKDVVPWSRAKETAGSTFPSDHATFMCLITWLWWQAGGRRIGLLALVLTILFALPRMAAGAHQATDTLIGGVFSALLAAGILQLTPLNGWIQRASQWMAGGIFAFEAMIKRRFSNPDLPNEPMGQQIIRGACMGTADLIPGVSGGTMALILGIYQRLLNAIAGVNRDFVKLVGKARFSEALRHIDFLFVLPLGIGILIAIVFFSRVIPVGWLIREVPEATFGLFFGLIAASVVSLLLSLNVTRLRSWLWWVAGLAAGLFVVMLVPAQTPSSAWFIFLCGAIAATAMLLPGVSGSFVLLVLGKYAEVLEALASFNMTFILPLIAGVATGAIAFASSISWLLANYRQRTMLTVIGVLTGSLLAVWPYQHWIYEEVGGKQRLLDATPYLPQHFDGAVLSGIVMMIIGVFLYRGIEKLASKAS
ncbi:MAG: DUF368 domain-containing protein [Moraxellaceae bacterium]|nr:DUF368 domain-containing protein [Moraxellaceae bacterium]MDZ4387580.1 DUF368 domain-containing protein [Moraxellaceae bacterium]